ncbi:hypothetical protein G9E11_08300 [Arthrobacter sp. IA7]|uniref:hypothetical protein n=1 Tax=Arthrobacter ipis TaxID=2716202 RepID=UPI001683FD7B|nr:hypothetical protein [Arthrobacter ipis]MBD1542244.1 hypothetical protein [Arthrobacter ipis]
METTPLPPLPPGVECRTPNGPRLDEYEDGGETFPMLTAEYRVHGLTVQISWVIGHVMGSFREPNKMTIDFDSFDYAQELEETGENEKPEVFDGITTSLLRSIPMAHARALMRDQYEQIAVAGVRSEVTPLPSRVEKDEDYVHIAQAYVSLVQVSVEPIKRLAEWTKEKSPDTWSARLRRARARGVLVGKGRQARIAPAYQATANEILAGLRAQKEGSHGS